MREAASGCVVMGGPAFLTFDETVDGAIQGIRCVLSLGGIEALSFVLCVLTCFIL